MVLIRIAALAALGCTFGLAQAQHGSHAAPHAAAEAHLACDTHPLACARTATPLFAADGRLWLAFATADRVFVTFSDDYGAHFGPPLDVTRAPVAVDGGADARPALAQDDRGRIVVAWTQMRGAGYLGDPWFALSDDGGASFSEPRRMSDHDAGGRFVTLAAAPDGGVLAAWIDRRGHGSVREAGEDGAGLGIVVSHLDLSGGGFEPARMVRESSCECCRLGVDFTSTGEAVLLWRHLYPDSVRDHAITTFADAHTPGPLHRVSVDDWAIDACPHHGPSLSIDARGRYHVAWFTEGRVRQGAYYAYSADGGRSFSEPLALIGPSGRPGARAQVLALPDGQVLLAWRELEAGRTRVVGQVWDEGAGGWSSPHVVSEVQGAADQPLLIHAPDGSGWLSWLTREEGYRLVPLSASLFDGDPTP